MTHFEYLLEHSNKDILEHIIEESTYNFCIDLIETDNLDLFETFIDLFEDDSNISFEEEVVVLESLLYYIENESKIYSFVLFEVEQETNPRLQMMQQVTRFSDNIKNKNNKEEKKDLYKDNTDNSKKFSSPEIQNAEQAKINDKKARLDLAQQRLQNARINADQKARENQAVREELTVAKNKQIKARKDAAIHQNRIEAKKEMEDHYKQYDEFKPETRFSPPKLSLFQKLKKFGGNITRGIRRGINYFRGRNGLQSQFRQDTRKKYIAASNHLTNFKNKFKKK